MACGCGGECCISESKTIKSIQNLADKNKYGTVSGTRMNGKTAKEIIAIYNHPKMKSFRSKMDKMKSHELMDLTVKLPKMLGIKVESVNEVEYKDALAKFNKELEKNSEVKKAAKHYKKSTRDVVQALQSKIKVNRYGDKSIKQISIDYKEDGPLSSKVSIKLSKNYKQNESVNEATDWMLKLDIGKNNPKDFKKWASPQMQRKHKIKVRGGGKKWIIVGDEKKGSSMDWIKGLLDKAWRVNKIKTQQIESVNEKVDKIGAIKKAFPWAKGKMMNVIQMAIEMDVDGLAGVMKNYKANPAAYKQFVRDMSKMKGLPDLKESVNEAVEPKGNMAKIQKIVNDKQAAKLGGVMIDMQSASLLMKLFDKVSDKDKEKMNKLNAKMLTTVIKRLWSRVNLKLPM